MAGIGVIGAGSWGIALSVLLHNNGNEVTVWSIIKEEITMLETEREHKDKFDLLPVLVPLCRADQDSRPVLPAPFAG